MFYATHSEKGMRRIGQVSIRSLFIIGAAEKTPLCFSPAIFLNVIFIASVVAGFGKDDFFTA